MSKTNSLKRTDHRMILKIAVFGALTVVSTALFVFGLINNSNGAVERFNTLKAVDEAGGDVESALVELRDYIHSHMNTELGGPNGIYPPIQLSGTYSRLVEQRSAQVDKKNEQARETNEKVLQDADRICASRFPAGQIIQRAECNAAYIEANSVSETNEATEIDESFYKFNYVAPRWSPDLAGFSLLFAIAFGITTVIYTIRHFHIKHLIHLGN